MTVSVGIIGAGSIARLHAAAFTEAGARLVAIADVRAEKARKLAAEHRGTEALQGHEALLARDDIDAVVVGIPNHLHRDVAIESLKAGKDVLLEKPMALDAAQCDEILAAHRGTDRILQLGFVCRGFPAALAAKAIVDSGRLGTIYHAKAGMYRRRGIPGLGRWFTTRAESGGGVLIDLGVHLIDLVMHLAGRRDATRVSAACESRFGHPLGEYTFLDMWAGPPELDGVFDVEDSATGLVRFGGDLSLEVNMTWAANIPDGFFKDGVVLLGDRGGLCFEHWADHVTLATEQGGHLEDVKVHVGGGDVWPIAFRRQAALFLEAVETRRPPAASGEHGRTVQAVLDAMYRSSREQCEVEVG